MYIDAAAAATAAIAAAAAAAVVPPPRKPVLLPPPLSISPGEHAIAILDPVRMTSLVRGTVALFTAAYAPRIGADCGCTYVRSSPRNRAGKSINNHVTRSCISREMKLGL